MQSSPLFGIEVLDGADRGLKLPLKARSIMLGRRVASGYSPLESLEASECILFTEPSVSRVHAMLEWDDREKSYTIQQKSTTNPTRVNSEAIYRKILKESDLITLGHLVFRFTRLEGENHPPALPEHEPRSGKAAEAIRSPKMQAPPGSPLKTESSRVADSKTTPAARREEGAPREIKKHAVLKRFEYLAEKPDGTTTLDYVDAESAYEATKEILGKSLKLTFIECIKEQVIPGRETGLQKLIDRLVLHWKRFQNTYGLGKRYRRVSDYTLYLFTQQLAVILDSGIPIIRGLQIIQQSEKDRNFKQIIRELSEHISAGASASQAFGKFPTVFPEAYRALLMVGESTGKVHETLVKQARDLEKLYSFRKKTISILTYPAVILLVSVCAVIFIMLYFVPSFTSMFRETGAALPLATTILIFIVKYMTDPAFWICCAAVAAIAFFMLHNYIATPIGKQHFDKFILKIPILGNLVTYIFLYTVFLNLACMLECGVNLVDALKVLLNTSRNVVFRSFFTSLLNQLGSGEDFSSVLKEQWFMPGFVIDFIIAGEMAGELPYMLRKAGNMLEEKVSGRIEALLNVFEPLIICSLAFIMGYVMISVFLPMYNVINSFSQ